jgi:hypothetical protein
VIKSESKLDSETSSNKSSAKLSLDGNFCSGSINSPLSCKYINFFLWFPSLPVGTRWSEQRQRLEHNTIEIINFICSWFFFFVHLTPAAVVCFGPCSGGGKFMVATFIFYYTYFCLFLILIFIFLSFFPSVGNLLSDNCWNSYKNNIDNGHHMDPWAHYGRNWAKKNKLRRMDMPGNQQKKAKYTHTHIDIDAYTRTYNGSGIRNYFYWL